MHNDYHPGNRHFRRHRRPFLRLQPRSLQGRLLRGRRPRRSPRRSRAAHSGAGIRQHRALPDRCGRAAIAAQGLYIKDWEDDYSTTTIDDKERAYALYDERGILKCGIEQAYLAGATTFKKPISCHLYPIRITRYEGFDALNYDRWGICNPACSFGSSLGVKVYQFLKEPLVRKYGEAWYGELVREIERRINRKASLG